MEKLFKPKNREELENIIEDVIIKQSKDSNYPYGLKDIDTSLITNMNSLFYKNNEIDWDDRRNSIVNWNVSNVTDMTFMFYYNKFNQDISKWDVSSVNTMYSMFAYNSNFNQPIGNWNVSNVTNMSYLFYGTPFNQDISNWNVSNVTSMDEMFSKSLFNQPICDWDVSNVNSMYSMFYRTPFNQNISNWNVSSVTNMSYMFSDSSFNQDIANWDVSNVTDMFNMFKYTMFDKNISEWSSKLNKDCNLIRFNYESKHSEKYGTINSYEDFLKIYNKNIFNSINENMNILSKEDFNDFIKDIDKNELISFAKTLNEKDWIKLVNIVDDPKLKMDILKCKVDLNIDSKPVESSKEDKVINININLDLGKKLGDIDR